MWSMKLDYRDLYRIEILKFDSCKFLPVLADKERSILSKNGRLGLKIQSPTIRKRGIRCGRRASSNVYSFSIPELLTNKSYLLTVSVSDWNTVLLSLKLKSSTESYWVVVIQFHKVCHIRHKLCNMICSMILGESDSATNLEQKIRTACRESKSGINCFTRSFPF